MPEATRTDAAPYYCPTCDAPVRRFKPGGPRRRPNAKCPGCGALERHRFLSVLLQGLGPVVGHTARVLDIAPSRYTTRLLDHLEPREYVRMDLDPEADGRAVDVQASLTALPFATASFDLIVCYHVLEHVPDDAAAMRELARTLRPGGLALVQVPFRKNRETDEDPDAPEDERIRRFGQADHVRWYGHDFEDRLTAAGLAGPRITPVDVLGEELCEIFGIKPQEAVWVLRRAHGSTGDPDSDGDQGRPGSDGGPAGDDGPPGDSTAGDAGGDGGPAGDDIPAGDHLDVEAAVRRVAAPANTLLTGLHRLPPPGLVADLQAEHDAEVARLTAELDDARRDLVRVRKQRDTWRARHERVTGHPFVRAASAPYRWLRKRSG